MKFFYRLCLAAAAVISAGSLQARPAGEKPNVIIILADDLGYAGLSCFGGEGISTPTLDRLAENGVKCENFYSNSTVCTPTRVALMTGRYQQRVGVDHIYYYCLKENDGLDPNTSPLLAKQFKAAGYVTGVFGKWHLGAGPAYRPDKLGFDWFTGFLDGNIDFISHHNTESKVDWWVKNEERNQEGYAQDLLNEAVVDFIDEHHEKPFFLYVPLAAVHVPMQGPKDEPLRTDSFYAYRVDHLFPRDEYMRRYSDMVTSIDRGVDMMMAALQKYELEENTLVIFTSDNGGEAIGVGHAKVNGPFRGHKVNMYEGGLRVPGLMYWKGMLGGESASQTSDEVMLTMDLFPTVLEAAGIEYNDDYPLDGVSLWPAVSKQEPLAERDLFWMHTERLVMRRGDWKLIRQDGGEELYNLADDLAEANDLSASAEQQERVQQMLKDSDQWRKETAIGVPAEREIGVWVKPVWPCSRDVKAFNEGREYSWPNNK
ncbi:sulfatase-like hydrolase/transferase [Persicirhabdus sediminis]|uniref:Sulfatase-like hydrolase/transferase n=1 Tax=Persicirhabdus sediminis TaxID=454144 RepID=A0A8J7MDZ5_9BACT|nr:sulfatase-like hydrolase/transferase [Persicirhabdus sediminis]MBK1792114.1 sulfatase-like hydrolase/transferase [Persicirhabdus sediminis]